LISRQIRTVGLTTPIVASGSIYSPKFIELAGDAANGVYTESNFFPGERVRSGKAFVSKFKAKYNEEPDDFNAVAYDRSSCSPRSSTNTVPIAPRFATDWRRSRTFRA